MEFLSQDFGGIHVETSDHVRFQASGMDLISAQDNKISLNGVENESQLHILERSAYTAVLRAFCAQSNALSWVREGLITELRDELRVSDVEHRQILALVSSDKSIKQLRGQKKQSESQDAQEAGHRNYDVIHVGLSKKKLTGGPHCTLKPISDNISTPSKAQKNKKDYKVRCIGGRLSAPVAPACEQHRYPALTHAPARAPVLTPAPAPAPAPAPTPTLRASKSINQQSLSKKKRISDAIHIRQTDVLIQQIKEACGNGNSDPVVVEKAKQALIDQEKVLMEAICIIDEVTDSEEPPKKGRKNGNSTSRRYNMSLPCIEKW